jgi:hypothetical protein
MLFSGAWGKMMHEKNQSKKSSDTVPLTMGEHVFFLIPTLSL